MPVKLNSTGGGSVTLTTPSTASDFTLTAPAQTATLITNSSGVLDIGSGQIYKDASGNVGIGTTSPGRKVDIEQSGTDYQLRIGDAGGNYYDIGRNTANGLLTFNGNQAAASGYVFSTVNGERARISTNGTLSLNTTLTTVNGKTPLLLSYQTASNPAISCYINSTSAANQMTFHNPNGERGSINTDATSTSYLTTSDYRLKENVTPLTSAVARVQALKPYRFNWVVDPAGPKVDGFLAHEAAEVVPQAVTGEKDAVNEDGSIKPQGIDHSKLVPLLTAALQEALTEIASLKSRLTALEAN